MAQAKSKNLSVQMSLRSGDATDNSMEECLKSEAEGGAPFLSGKESSGSDVDDDAELEALREEQERCAKKLIKRQTKARKQVEKDNLRKEILRIRSELSNPIIVPAQSDQIQNGEGKAENSFVSPVLLPAPSQGNRPVASGECASVPFKQPVNIDQVSAINDREIDRNNAISSIIGHSKMAPLSDNEKFTNLSGLQPLPPVNLLTPVAISEPSRPTSITRSSRNTAGLSGHDIVLLPSDLFVTNALQECRINAVHSLPGYESQKRHAVGADGRVYNSSSENDATRSHVRVGIHGVQPVAGSAQNNRDVRPKTRPEDSDYSARSDSSIRLRNLPKRGKNVLQSGILARSTDLVKFPQDWPHIALHSDTVGGTYSFHELDATLFMSGELELITRSNVSETEHDGRLNLLKQLNYLSRVYDWQTILKVYTEVVSNIEKGLLSWSSMFETTINSSLQRQGSNRASSYSSKNAQAKFSGPKKSQYKAKPTYYCKDYQNSSCTFTDDKHWGYVSGEKVFVEHVCAACLMKRKETVRHGENSPECPCKGGRGGSQ